MTLDRRELVRQNLSFILSELVSQSDLADHFGGDNLSFDEQMEQLRLFIEDVGEYGVAYEVIVATAEQAPFTFSSKAAIKLLEVGLLLGFKTDRPEDSVFNVGRR